MKLSMPPRIAELMNMHFFSLLEAQGEGSVMFVGPYPPCSSTLMYDLDLGSVFSMPQANFCKRSDSISSTQQRSLRLVPHTSSTHGNTTLGRRGHPRRRHGHPRRSTATPQLSSCCQLSGY
jgi:hypothetical protein